MNMIDVFDSGLVRIYSVTIWGLWFVHSLFLVNSVAIVSMRECVIHIAGCGVWCSLSSLALKVSLYFAG